MTWVRSHQGWSPLKNIAWLLESYKRLQESDKKEHLLRYNVVPYIGDQGHNDLWHGTENEVDLFFRVKERIDEGINDGIYNPDGTLETRITQEIIDECKQVMTDKNLTLENIHDFVTENGFHENFADGIHGVDKLDETEKLHYLLMAKQEIESPTGNIVKAGLALHRIGLYEDYRVAKNHPFKHYVVALNELVNKHIRLYSAFEDKLLTQKNVKEKIGDYRKNGLKIGFTNGCFDLVHSGHIRYLQEAASQCDYLVVAINTDRSVKELKGEDRPVHDAQERLYLLAALPFVDAVMLFDETTATEAMRTVKPNVYFKGGDYALSQESAREGQAVLDSGEMNYLSSIGCGIKMLDFAANKSTSAIIRKVRGK